MRPSPSSTRYHAAQCRGARGPWHRPALLLGLGLLGLVSQAPVAASDSAGAFAVKGAGGAGCAQFLRATRARDHELGQFLGWANGYFTRYNQAEASTFDILPWQSSAFLLVALADHCERNPGETFAAAVSAFSRSLESQRLTAKSELLPPGSEGQPPLYAEVVRRLQARLRDVLGEPELALSGQLDGATAGALKRFQILAGLEPSGVPDQPTLLRLFYPPQADGA